ncbi:MAG TPA: FHA domain-containing protein, partial [Polyangia bacterium]
MAQPAVLHVIGGADRGKTYELVLPETRVGRGADQDLVLADIAVSRRHFTIHAESGRYRMRDLGSGNGTLVNGQRLDTVILNDGDQLECGNTLMRFDQAVARAAPPSHQPAPPPMAAPPPYASPSAAPSYMAPSAPSYPMNVSAVDTPSDNVPSAVPIGGGASRSISLPIGLATPLSSSKNRMIVFGAMGALSLIFLIVIVAKTAFAKPPVVPSEAEQSYRAGLKLFLAKDYEGAKMNFSDALQLAPDSAEAKRYVAVCDLEVHARGAQQTAERAIASHRYAEAVKALDAVDSASLLHDDAVKRRKEMAPKAAAEDVEEARRLQQEDPDTARARVQQALALDPGNAEARALAPKMHVDLPPPPANTVVASPLPTAALVADVKPTPVAPPPRPIAPPTPVAKEPKAAVQKEPPAPREPKKTKMAAAPKDDDDFAPVKVTKKDAALAAKVEAPSSAAALAAYKAKDFGNAERLYRMEARNQPVKQMEKTIQFANQVRDLKAVLDKAAADEGKNPTAAVSDYEMALTIDGRIGRGQHAGYFKQRIGKLQIPLAQQAFSQGKYEQAFVAVQAAQKSGAGDGGMLKQLEAKAKELTDKGAAVQKSNPGQAKQYWHQVIKIVPSSSPSYARAYQLLNAG